MISLPSGIRLLLFDAGNTLLFVDYTYLAKAACLVGGCLTATALRSAEIEARVEMDRLISQEPASTDRSRWRRYFQVMLETAGLSTAQFDAAVPLLVERHREVGLWIHVRPWTRPVLKALRRSGYRMAVVSNADGRVEQWLFQKGLGEYFDLILDSQLVGIEKPDPAIFELALRQTGCLAGEAVHVGDLYAVDVVGARGAGITPVLLDPYGLHPAEDCVKIRRLSELRRLLPPEAPEVRRRAAA